MLRKLSHQLAPRVMTGHSQTSQSWLCNSDPPLLFTASAWQDRFPHSQALPTSFVPQMYNFPQTVLKHMFNTLEEQSTLLSALVSLLLIAFTPSCVIFKRHQHQNFVASPGPPAEPCGTCKKHQVTGDSKFMTTFGHCQLHSLSFFYYTSCTCQHTLDVQDFSFKVL